jgi:hypothetical protein
MAWGVWGAAPAPQRDAVPHFAERTPPRSPAIARNCHCGSSGTTEGLLSIDAQLWQCTYDNPEAFVTFTDQGCASQIRYGPLPAPDAGYAACLTSAYASLRWSCATTGTHFVMFHTARPLGGF